VIARAATTVGGIDIVGCNEWPIAGMSWCDKHVRVTTEKEDASMFYTASTNNFSTFLNGS